MALFVSMNLFSQSGTDATSVEPAASAQLSDNSQPPDERSLVLGDESAQENPGITVSPFGIWDLLRMILVLGVVVGVIYLVFFVLKRTGKGKVGSSEAIRIIGSQSLPGNRYIYLIEVGGQVFLVGSGSDSVSLISEITDRETVDALVLKAGEEQTGSGRSFGDLVAGLLKGGQTTTLDLMRNQRQRLQRLRQ